MAVTKIKEYLDANQIRYVTITHSPAYTSQKTAASAHVPGKELAKTVIVRVDGQLAMAVLPGSHQVDFGLLKEAVGASKIELASEDDFRDKFPDCEVGAMPPFGNLYDMPVYVAETLSEDDEIAFNACSHTELIRMSYEDFSRLVEPTIVRFAATARP
jgi:Ala-tRNA(Pro) deacylase